MLSVLRVLILEDDPSLRGILKQVLEEQGYAVETAACGTEALDWSRRAAFDLVVVDVRMEGMDGLDALSKVQEAQPAIGSMVMTGYSTEEDSIRAIHLGVREYLKKPFDLQVFLEALERVAAERRRELERARLTQTAGQAVLWALGRVGDERARSVADFARGVALRLGSSEPEGNAVWAALMLRALEEAEPPPGLQQVFPPFKGLQPRLVEESSRLLEREPPGEQPVSRFLGLEGAMAEAMDAQWGKSLPPARPARNAGLLALSRALLLSGKTEEALAGLREVASGGPPREELEALLWMARAAASQGDGPGLRELGQRACHVARQVGPQALARTTLDYGLLLAELPSDDAASALAEAHQQFASLGLESEAARARLALRHFAGQGSDEEVRRAMGVLLQPANLPELVEALGWMLPLLLEQVGARPDEAGQRVLGRLAQQFPREFVRSVSTAALTPPARCAAAACLTPSNPWHKVALGTLSEDSEPEVRAAATATLERQGGVLQPPLLRLHSLGPFEVYLGDEPVADGAWKGQKTRYLLAYLAASRGQVVPEDRLVDSFWPDSPPKRGRRNLYTTTSYLRAALKLTGWSGTLDFVVRSGLGLALSNKLPRWHDYEELERLLLQARKSPPNQALECWRSALRLYRGPYLDGCNLEWINEPRRRLEREIVGATEEVTRLCLSRGLHREGLEFALRLMELDPCHLEACQMAMQACAQLGRHEEAVRLFERSKRSLARELGAEPPLALFELYQRAKLQL